jgi:hypothetical protein
LHHTLQGTFEDKSYIHLVMEVCEGGELFDRIAEKGHFSEKQVGCRHYTWGLTHDRCAQVAASVEVVGRESRCHGMKHVAEQVV